MIAGPPLLTTLVDGLHAHKNGSGYKALCPAHADTNPSLGLSERNGTVLVRCYAGCSQETVIAALRERGLWPATGVSSFHTNGPTVTVRSLAEHKGLPVDFLKQRFGLHDLPDGRGVGIPYRAADGSVAQTKRRTALVAKEGSFWPKGVPLMAYGLEGVGAARQQRTLDLVEGESNTWTLIYHDTPTLGIPGANGTHVLEAAQLEGIDRLRVWQDPDSGGAQFVAGIGRRLAALGWTGEAVILRPSEGIKDANELHRRHGGNREAFAAAVAELVAAAGPFVSPAYRDAVPAERKIAFESAREIAATAPERPDFVAEPYAACGAVTELDGPPKRAGKTTFAAFMVRSVVDGVPFLGRPTMKSGVVILTEQTPTTLRESLELAGLLDREDVLFVRWHRHRGMQFADVVAQAAAECVRRGWLLLIIDTISQWAGIKDSGENDAGPAMAAMEPCQEAAGLGLAVVVVRHDRKAGGLVGESGRGSNAFSGAVDIVLQLTRPEGNPPATHRVVNALSRFRDTPARLVIDLTADGYVSLGDAGAVVAHGVREAILDHLPDIPENAWTIEQIIEACAIATGRRPGRTTAQEVLDALGSAEREPARVRSLILPNRGRPKVYWLAREGD